ncbi:septum site-determining protein MinC [Pistricoccus aurantiacus]|uniref:Probable septum site-determining protein MinC n=1 Tax=Pistricoccus aurantiacus TaxID=1883414 RepID=A0A5B8SR19_9GAMM|nr:septum site-determining protein MinC [Pistricoccus aurantiacus]QEA37865.1 septum site-determining protein MinC [Pistricoccus aurantiacus]
MGLNLDRTSMAFTFKGGMLPMTVMELTSADPEHIRSQLTDKLNRSPAFFQHTPVVLGVEKLKETHLALERICAVCRDHKLLPVAVRGGAEPVKQSAWALGLGWFPPQEIRSRELESVTPVEPPVVAKIDASSAVSGGRVFRGTVRSGQQLSAQSGDLVVVGAVNAGAEVLAAGSVHVYGPLRGRALAGILGDTQAGIFCHELNAELLSVAGNYKRMEDIEPQLLGRSVQVRLSDDQLTISPLNG